MNINAPRIAAFFDIDGTLLPPPSLERQMLRYLRWRDELPGGALLRWSSEFLKRAWRSPLAATHGNKAHYRGVRVRAMETFCALLRRHPLPLIPAALEWLTWHATRGHAIMLVSGTLRPLALCIAQHIAHNWNIGEALPIRVVAATLEVHEGRFTGRTAGEPVCGRAKAAAVHRLARELGLDLLSCFAYGNGYADRRMLGTVGHPTAVNPSVGLRLFARHHGWPVVEWNRRPTPEQQMVSEHLHALYDDKSN